ncbi:MAG: hypothetical protein MR357_05150 [Anaeroplasma sp.]|nr:hypothetical protein [Anaeroplasma sp.]
MKRFKIHFSFYILFLCMILSRYQILYLKLLLLIFLHELGHILVASIFKIKINRIVLTGMGLFMDAETNDLSFIKGIIFYLSGLIINLILLFFLKEEFKKINLFILIINLIPIYPTDGYNILNSIISYFFPYKISKYVSNYLSLILSCIIFCYFINKMDFLLFVMLLYLVYLSIISIRNINFDYERFLLNRYLNNFDFKTKRIHYKNNIDNMFYKYKIVEANLANKLIKEKDILKIKYNNVRF